MYLPPPPPSIHPSIFVAAGRPEMLSSRFRIDSVGGGDHDDGGGGGGGASATGSSRRVTRSASRNMALTPEVADGRGAVADAGVRGGKGRGASPSDSDSSDDGYDSDKCPTPELSSPLRSASFSARDIRALTPSAAGPPTGSGGDEDSDACPTPELPSPLRSAGSAALCRRRLEEAGGEGGDADEHGGEEDGGGEESAAAKGGPLELVSEEEYAKVRVGTGCRLPGCFFWHSVPPCRAPLRQKGDWENHGFREVHGEVHTSLPRLLFFIHTCCDPVRHSKTYPQHAICTHTSWRLYGSISDNFQPPSPLSACI